MSSTNLHGALLSRWAAPTIALAILSPACAAGTNLQDNLGRTDGATEPDTIRYEATRPREEALKSRRPVPADHPLASAFGGQARVYRVEHAARPPRDETSEEQSKGCPDESTAPAGSAPAATCPAHDLSQCPTSGGGLNVIHWPELDITTSNGTRYCRLGYAVVTVKLGGSLTWSFSTGEHWPCQRPTYTLRSNEYVDEMVYWQDGYLDDGDQSGWYLIENALYTNSAGRAVQQIGTSPAVLGTFTWDMMNTHRDRDYHPNQGIFLRNWMQRYDCCNDVFLNHKVIIQRQ